jgi:hypothetical protein
MAAQYLTAWNPLAVVAAHDALVTVVGSNAKITIHDTGDVLLAEMILSNPCGTVNGTTGVLTLSVATQEDSALATGVADYASIRKSDDTVLRSIPCMVGATPVAGYCVLNTLNINETSEVELVSATIQ